MPSRHTIRLALLLAFLIALSADARPPSDSDWNYHYSINQCVGQFVDWRQGHEKLILATRLLQTPGSGMVIALPCKSHDATVQLQTHIPVYQGRFAISSIHENLERITSYACLTQIYPFLSCFAPSLGRTAELPPTSATHTVHGLGLRCQIVDANDPAALDEKIAASAIVLPPAESTRIAKYADPEHCFVLITVASLETYAALTSDRFGVSITEQSVPCIELNFPALQPVIPAHTLQTAPGPYEDNACVLGNVTPVKPQKTTRVGHFVGRLYTEGATSAAEVPYTRIMQTQPPDEFWLNTSPDPYSARLQSCINFLNHSTVFIILTLLWTAACSYLVAGTAGLIIAQRWKGYARLGLWNLATIIALAIAASRQTSLEKLHRLLRRRAFLLCFTILFLALNGAISYLLALLLGLYWPYDSTRLWPWYGIGG